MRPAREDAIRRAAVGLALLLPVAILFAPVLGHPFVELDDVYYVALNPALRDLSWDGVRFLFLEDQRDFRWFPTTYLSLALDRRLLGAGPASHHATNLLLHLANTALVFALVRGLFRDVRAAAGTALLFGLHPLQVEPVAWVMGRKDVLFLLFFLLSIAAYRRSLDAAGPGARAGWLGGSVALFLGSITAKTTAVTLPAVLVLVDRTRDPDARLGPFLRRSLPSKLAYLPVVALAWGMTRALSSRSPYATDYDFSVLEWAAIVGHNLFFYPVRAVAPFGLSVFYPLPDDAAPLPPHFLLFAAGGLALVALCLWSWRRHPRAFFGLAWYLGTMLPTAIAPAYFSDVPLLAADRYFYVASVGPFFLAGVAFSEAWRRCPPRGARAALAVACAALVAGYAGLASRQVRVWRGTIPLYQNAVRHQSSDAFYYRLALEYAKADQMGRAFNALDAAEAAPHRIFFDRLLIHQLRLSDLYRRRGDWARAAEWARAAIEATPNAIEPVDARTPLAWTYLAHLLERADRPAAAAEARRAAESASLEPSGYFERIWFSIAPDLAEAILRRRIADDPRDAAAWAWLGLLQDLHGESEAAAASRRRARALGFEGRGRARP